MEGKKNVTTHDNSGVTKNMENGKKNFVMMFKTLSRQMKREINEDTMKQCHDIKVDCRNIKNCRMKKLCHDLRKLSREISWQIMKVSHD